jgi:hypothetical protein
LAESHSDEIEEGNISGSDDGDSSGSGYGNSGGIGDGSDGDSDDGDGRNQPGDSEKERKIISEIVSYHQRVGHAPYKKIIEMVKSGRISGVSKELEKVKNVRMVLEKMKRIVCEACICRAYVAACVQESNRG